VHRLAKGRGTDERGTGLGIREEFHLREPFNRAAEMPHRQSAGDDRLDARLASEIGRLFFGGDISEPEYAAGVRYGLIGLRYLQSIDGPEPFGSDIGSLSDDVCFARKVMFASAREALKPLGKQCSVVVDRVAIYDEPLRDGELPELQRALRALCGL
jgi:hypothetical protein